ncbi:MAG: metal-dependent hydrolase [Myxococcales bacterium]|nr:metal-dependent hydrolase [Myxococcales bacterium]MCB9627278.1 metal-dependent hydrolase [Sandaracinaceae bacterium]
MNAHTTPIAPQQARNRAPIPRRKMEFDFHSAEERFWFANNGLITAMLSALSATFPPGEKEFVQSVMHYRDQISDPVLLEQMKGFASQEGHHSYQHRQANAWLDTKGFAATDIEQDTERSIAAMGPKRGPAERLASTVVLEHITAILAEYMLTHDEMMASMPDAARELLSWHAVEEIEHKAVAFDVFEAVSGDRDLLHRVGAMTTAFFLFQQVRRTALTLKALGHRPTVREWKDTATFLFGRKGVITSVAKPYREFFSDTFHPWDHDNSHLVERWKATHEPAVHA